MLALLSLAACAAGERQGGLTLEAKLPTTFAQLSNVVELGNGRVMFADTKDKLFLSADLGSGKVDTLGARLDSVGPTTPASAYKFPGWVARLGGDTVALVDFSAVRTTLWNAQGRALSVLPVPPVSGATPVLLYDTVGHGYKIDYQAIFGGGEPGRTIRPDSIPVLRITLKTGAVDTIAHLAAPDYGAAKFGQQVQQAAKVFGPNDFFGVLPDGTVWVARSRENLVEWRSPEGEWVRGQPRAYTKIPVTEEDKRRVLAKVRERGKQFGMPQDLEVEYPFADTKPAFDFALARPSGELWLQRSRAAEDEPVLYDVYDRKGMWRREVSLPNGATLAGFGENGAVYASLKDGKDSDRRTVARFRLE